MNDHHIVKEILCLRTLRVAVSVLLLQGILCSHSHGAAGDVDPSFDPGSGPTRNVQFFVVQPDGKVVVGGEGELSRLNADGSNDRSFAPRKSIHEATLSALALQPDGRVLEGHHEGVDRLLPDGTLDSTFNATIDSADNSYVSAIAVQPNGRVLIGGSFGAVNGVYRPKLARVNADGSLDDSFNAIIPSASSYVGAVSLQADGKVLVGGRFYDAAGTQNKSLLRLNADGSLDNSFISATSPGGVVISVDVQPDGKVVAGGNFSVGTRINIARLNANGTVDPGFNATVGENSRTTVFSVELQPDGKLVIAGAFGEVNGVARNALVRVNADGALDEAFNPGSTLTSTDAEVRVGLVTVQPDGRLIISGSFTHIKEVIRDSIARLEADGTLDESFNPGGGLDEAVSAIAVQPDGKVLISGHFTSVNGLNRYGIARLHPDGSLDNTTFYRIGTLEPVSALALQPDGKVLIGTETSVVRVHPDGSRDVTYSFGGGATALAVQPDGKILVGGYNKSVVVEEDGSLTTYHRLYLNRRNSDGSLDTTFEQTIGEMFQDLYTVTAFAVQPDGKILVAGVFRTFKGVARFGIARVNFNGTLDSGFTANASNFVTSVALQPDGKVLIGGLFTVVDGTSRRRVARLHANGSLDTTFDPGTGGNNTVLSLAHQPDGKVLIGGYFTNINGTSRNRIARLNGNGSLDTSFDPGTGADERVTSIAVQPDGNVLIGGGFTLIDGVASPYVARLYGDSPPPASFVAWISAFGLTGAVAAPGADPDHDGIPNAVEFVLGGNPAVPALSGRPTATVSGGNMVFTFQRDDASETPDVTLTVESGTDLLTWPVVFNVGPNAASSSPGVSISENGAAPDMITVTIPHDTKAKFARLKVTITPL